MNIKNTVSGWGGAVSLFSLFVWLGCTEAELPRHGYDPEDSDSEEDSDSYPEGDTDTDADTDTDTDADTDTDTDVDTETDPTDPSDSDSSADTDTDTDTDTDSDTDADSDTDSDSDTDTDADTDSTWVYDFAADTQGFTLAWAQPTSLQTTSSLNHTSAQGSGALQLTVPFTAADQKIQVSVNPASSLDLSGKTVTAWVKLESGLSANPSTPGGAKLFVKSGTSYVYADGGWNNFETSSGWIQLSLNIDNPAGYISDPSFNGADITEIGVEIDTNSSATSASTAVLYIDNIAW